MIPGGNWESQNKRLPGAYIRFISKSSNVTVDNYPDNKPEIEPSTTSAVLGIAILGYMLLGTDE